MLTILTLYCNNAIFIDKLPWESVVFHDKFTALEASNFEVKYACTILKRSSMAGGCNMVFNSFQLACCSIDCSFNINYLKILINKTILIYIL